MLLCRPTAQLYTQHKHTLTIKVIKHSHSYAHSNVTTKYSHSNVIIKEDIYIRVKLHICIHIRME